MLFVGPTIRSLLAQGWRVTLLVSTHAGHVVTGMDYIDKIAALPTATVYGFGDVVTTEVIIQFVAQTQ